MISLNTNILLNNNFHNKNQKQIAFKGYAACPIKALYMQYPRHYQEGTFSVFKELHKIGLREKFEVFFQTGIELCKIPSLSDVEIRINKSRKKSRLFHEKPWSQDDKMFILDKDGKEILLLEPSEYIVPEQIDIPHKEMPFQIEGGNIYIGKKSNGETYAIIGENSLYTRPNYVHQVTINNSPLIEKELNIKSENIHGFTQPCFHIDMSIRPLKGNDILVNDYDTTVNILEEHRTKQTSVKIDELINNIKLLPFLKNTKKIQSELESTGFTVIKIPGVIRNTNGDYSDSENANFMNAIIHQRENGDLVYITNHCDLNPNVYGVDFNKMFESYLRKIPYIKQIDFIKGSTPPTRSNHSTHNKNKTEENFISYSLRNLKGGVHCMIAERPNFEKWV